ncbi:hypothetical protein ACFOQM_06745 [Paenibacillus sp. GCM10012307]|uniref:Uncharacterized protein n=1 Tax=Paenibacillus roseus TaxID=2798579 RepID=A0A934MPL4_9BACL|nr:hypothetical protein [Paenibacillus roseus]MBJ6360998.1 hypothetical protein [Paenibacillus roseus]
MVKMITFKNKSIPVYLAYDHSEYLDLLNAKLGEMSLQFDFYKKWKRIKSVELIRDVAILKYTDGTKLYLEVS